VPGGEAGAPQTWKQAFDEQVNDPETKISQAEHDALVADQYHGGRFTPTQTVEYGMGTRAVLIMAAYLDKKGILGVRQTYPELDTCVANLNRMTRGGVINPRISVVL
jgi:ribosomal protein S12 methylthiotransferase accessory factor YcaO